MKRKVLFMTLAMAVVLTACGGNADKVASSNADANVSEDAGTAADDGAEPLTMYRRPLRMKRALA